MYKTFLDEAFDIAIGKHKPQRWGLKETETGYDISVLLPGFTKEEVAVTVENDFIKVNAETDRELPGFISKKENLTFKATDVDSESISAKLENGLLILSVAKKVEKQKKTILVI